MPIDIVAEQPFRIGIPTVIKGPALDGPFVVVFEDDGETLKFLMKENVPGSFPFTAGVFAFKREGEDPTRMFAGEGDAFRTNRRFKRVSEGMPAHRLSTAFDSVTLYGCDPDPRPDIYGKIGNSGVSIASLDDMKVLYDGFDLVNPTTSVSMTINGPAPIILAMFFNTALAQQLDKFKAQNGRQPTDDEAQKIREWVLATVRGTLTETPTVRVHEQQGQERSRTLVSLQVTALATNASWQAAAGTIAVHGQHLARSAIRFSADSLSLAGSETAGARLDLVARAGDIDASGARIGIDETLSASAAGTFRSDAAQISAARLDFTARNLSNRAGSLIQTGSTDLAIRLPGRFDNQGGRLASASAALDLAAIAIDNSDGRIEHVGGGSFSLATPTLNGPRGSLFSAGNLRIGATDVILDGGDTRADSLQIDSARLSNIGGQIIQSGSGPARVHATAVFDNGSGSLVANGRLDLTAGELRNVAGKVLATADAGLVVTVDGAAENRGGSLVAGGDLSFAAATLGNVGGSLRAGQDGAVRLGGAVDNTDGTLAAGRRLDVDAASLDNRRGLVHSAAGGLGVHVVGALLNPLGEIFAGTDLDLRAGSLVSSGTLYSQRDLRIAVADTLSSSGSLAAAGNLSLSAYRFAGTAGSLLGAGLAGEGALTLDVRDSLVAQGRNQAAGALVFTGRSVDVATGETRAARIALTASDGDVSTREALVAAPGAVVIAAASPARRLDNRGGQISAGQLDLGVANLDNRAGSLLQTGSGDTAIATGSLDNRGGRIATNSRRLTLSADTLANTDGLIQHAGSGTADDALSIAVTDLAGSQGLIVAAGALAIDAQRANLDGADTRAGRIRIDSPVFIHRGATLASGGSLSLRAETLLDNDGGRIVSTGAAALQVGEMLNRQGTLQTGATAALALAAAGAIGNSSGGAILAGGVGRLSAARLDNRDGTISADAALDPPAVPEAPTAQRPPEQLTPAALTCGSARQLVPHAPQARAPQGLSRRALALLRRTQDFPAGTAAWDGYHAPCSVMGSRLLLASSLTSVALLAALAAAWLATGSALANSTGSGAISAPTIRRSWA